MISTMQNNSDDTHASKAGAVAQHDKQPTQFLDLPTELRWKVYSHFLPTEDVPEECYPNWSSSKLPHFVVPVDPPVLMRLWADARQYCQQEMRFTPCALASNPDRKLMAPCRAFRPDFDTLCLLSIDDAPFEAWTKAMREHFKRSKSSSRGFRFKPSKTTTALRYSGDKLCSEAYQDQFFRPQAIRNVRIGASVLLHGQFRGNTISSVIQDYSFVLRIARDFRGATTPNSRYQKCLGLALYDSFGTLTPDGSTGNLIAASSAEIANRGSDFLLLFDAYKNNWVAKIIVDNERIRPAGLNKHAQWSRPPPASMKKWRSRQGRFGLGDGSVEEVVKSLRD